MWHHANRTTINGVELSYAEHGRGEPVLLVHGSNVDERIWNDHSEILASRCRAIALTQRYFGVYPWPDDGRAFSIRTHASDLAAFIRALEVDQVTLVGWSYGAAVCLVMATQHSELVKRLFAYEPTIATFLSDPLEREQAQADRLDMIGSAKAAAAAGDSDRAVELFVDGVNDEVTFRGLSEPVQAMMLQNSHMLPLLFAAPPPPEITCDDLRRLRVPVTIALGAASRKFYRIAATRAARCIPEAQLVVVPRARHMWPIQDPRGFSRLVLDFLDRASVF